MRFAESFFSAAVVVVVLCSAVSCSAPAATPAPEPPPATAPAPESAPVPAPEPAPDSQANINADAPVVLKMSLPSSETVIGAKRVRSWLNSRIECVVDGTDSGKLKYSWSSTDGTLRAGSGFSLEGGTASRVDWMAPAAGGDYRVNVTVSDSGGNEAKGQVNFKVVCCTE